MYYQATSAWALDTAAADSFEKRPGQFFHVAPFGTAEQHPYLDPAAGGKVFLLPQFGFEQDNSTVQSEAEFYLGVTGLAPPQNLSILVQVIDGTADPLSAKPVPHIAWNYSE